MLGIYIHIPFCIRKCPYCDFYSCQYTEDLCDRYVDALCSAIKVCKKEKCDTIYFGGGTPNLLNLGQFDKILNAIFQTFDVEKNAEISLESNPALCDIKKLKSIRKLGFNRISIGVQSFCDDELKLLGRLHNAQQAEKAIFDAKIADFENISADFMICLPHQSSEKLFKTMQKIQKLPISHISAYMLKIEENTPFSKQGLILPDEDLSARLYLESAEFFEKLAFSQYEISNFAKSGFECRHNLKYWQRQEYLGFGPAAHSFYNNKRFAQNRDLKQFLSNPANYYITDENCDEFEETLLLNLRLSSGFDVKKFQNSKIDGILKRAEVLQKYGLLNVENKVIKLTKQGFLVSNSIISSLFKSE